MNEALLSKLYYVVSKREYFSVLPLIEIFQLLSINKNTNSV